MGVEWAGVVLRWDGGESGWWWTKGSVSWGGGGLRWYEPWWCELGVVG